MKMEIQHTKIYGMQIIMIHAYLKFTVIHAYLKKQEKPQTS